jgi:hypothetical protein
MKVLHPHLGSADPIVPDACYGGENLDYGLSSSRELCMGKDNRGSMRFARQIDIEKLKKRVDRRGEIRTLRMLLLLLLTPQCCYTLIHQHSQLS